MGLLTQYYRPDTDSQLSHHSRNTFDTIRRWLQTDDALAGNQVDLELPVWEQEGSDEGPDEQTCRCPLGRDPDPDRRPPDIDKLSALANRGRPASQEHR